MDLQDLKNKSKVKALFWAKSGRGKTYQLSKLALKASRKGLNVLYLDTESEGSTTMVELIENGDFDEEDLDNVKYKKISTFKELREYTDPDEGHQRNVDILIIDTLDHKHTYTIKEVTEDKQEPEADWNEYPAIYSKEKQIMENLGDPNCHVAAAIDPDSGKASKPKGAQTNVRGYFTIVAKLTKDGSEWSNKILNFVGGSDYIGAQIADKEINDVVLETIKDRE